MCQPSLPPGGLPQSHNLGHPTQAVGCRRVVEAFKPPYLLPALWDLLGPQKDETVDFKNVIDKIILSHNLISLASSKITLGFKRP